MNIAHLQRLAECDSEMDKITSQIFLDYSQEHKLNLEIDLQNQHAVIKHLRMTKSEFLLFIKDLNLEDYTNHEILAVFECFDNNKDEYLSYLEFKDVSKVHIRFKIGQIIEQKIKTVSKILKDKKIDQKLASDTMNYEKKFLDMRRDSIKGMKDMKDEEYKPNSTQNSEKE
eukprot:CAMPEP_0116891904 /NCGR_PEP_ID=MMETSP0467-20121206/2226_1 /TAXON_ID=283647 /ORGANISM="Mesodinium pulex, Strain SPMC105" /LENGTH=170 /DNA_ID=CAMNT_0004560697 /DNA_START=1 /DNA_END=513 /DNA_ORIENTATION=+